MAYREGIVKNSEFLTTSELAKKLKMNVQVITRKVKAGEIPAYKIGKDWRIPEQSVYNWMEKSSNQTAEPSKEKTPTNSPEKAIIEKQTVRRTTRKYLLEYILAQFEPNRTYGEDEVNRTIARYHDDYDAVRREFVIEKMMDQAGGKYCRRTGYRFSD
ncbi:MAG: DUF2087 domain-containing protein [candidate division Zixibacteria bacterium]|nr:DUF2087 domain-containing protein [candidate division Zixibacteria bacterium]